MSFVYFDISIGGVPKGTITMKLFSDLTPLTCQNFKCLCTGEKGLGMISNKPLHYKRSIFHRVIPGFMAQGGDFTARNGTGGESIYGGKFKDENFRVKHNKPGLLSMANAGPNSNGSQFFITFAPAPHLDGKHVVFGEVVQGMDVLKLMEKVDTGDRDKPVTGQEITIEDCGEVGRRLREEEPKKNWFDEAEKKQDSASEEDAEKKVKKHKKTKKEKEKKKSSDKKKTKKRKKSSSSSSSDNSSEDEDEDSENKNNGHKDEADVEGDRKWKLLKMQV